MRIKPVAIDWISIGACALAAIALTALYVAAMGWPKWVPWSAEKKLPVVEAQAAQTKDDLLVSQAQQGVSVDTAKATHDTLTIRIQQEAQTREDIAAIEAAPDAGARRDAFMRSLCRDPRYVSEPECSPYG